MRRHPKSPTIQDRLGSNSMASSFLEQAETLSKEGKFRRSIATFQQSAKLFGEVERFLNVKDWEAANIEERKLIEDLRDLAWLKRKYCLARIDVEEAKRRRMRGDYVSCIHRYASATAKFEEIVEELKRRALSKAHESSRPENVVGRDSSQPSDSSETDTLLRFIYEDDSTPKEASGREIAFHEDRFLNAEH